MRLIISLIVISMLAACTGARSTIAPERAATLAAAAATRPAAPTREVAVPVTPRSREARPTLASGPRQINATPLSAQAADAITMFARQQLGLIVQVVRAGGLAAQDIQLPSAVDGYTSAALSLAGQTYAAALKNGAASVSFGAGTSSGDLTIDINAASLGIFVLDGQGLPADAQAALDVLQVAFPAVAGLEFTALTAQNGYAFSAKTTQAAIDPTTREASVVAKGVIIGVAPTANGPIVYAAVGTGEFAASLAP